MDRIYVEVEENPNSWYLPLQTFETRGEPKTASAIRVDAISGSDGPHDVVGWSSEGGGTPCDVTYVEISDSGAAVSLLVMGGDYGIRMRPANSPGPWSLDDETQRGDPYALLPPEIGIMPLPAA